MNIILYKRDRLIECSGGEERVLCDFANAFVQRGHQMTLLLNERKTGQPFFPLDSRVCYINQGGTRFSELKHGLFKSLLSFSLGRKFLKHLTFADEYRHTSKCLNRIILHNKPDAIIAAGLPEIIDLLYETTYDVPVILMLHNTPEIFFISNKNGRLDILRELLKKVALVQVLMPGFEKDPLLKKYYTGPIVTIGNTVPEEKTSISYENNKKSYVMTYLARLCPVKNQELVIRAFSLIATEYPEWKIEFWGSNNDKKYTKRLTNLISRYGLQKQIRIMGVTRNPRAVLAGTDLCPFASNFEGFGLGLTEAMSMGIPCIGLKKSPAVNQLIIHEETGLLVDDTPEEFSLAMKKLMSSASLRATLGRNARKSLSPFTPENIWSKWEDVLNTLISI